MGVVVATAMSVTIVVGAGLLALPGISYALAGRYGYLPWLAVAVAMIPLLKIFADFATHHPSAGGVVGYVRLSLGTRMAGITEVIALGTFSLGIPAIALIGADYLRAFLPDMSVTYAAIGLVTLAYVAGLVGVKLSGKVQTGLATFIVLGLLAIGLGFWWQQSFVVGAPELEPSVLGMTQGSSGHPLAGIGMDVDTTDWGLLLQHVVAGVPVVLFAYTGWELTAFLAEDMHEPEHTLPISIWSSFVLVTGMYLFIAWLVATYANDDPGWQTTPFVLLAKAWLGEGAGRVVALIGVLVVLANVVGAFLSASRGIFAAGRDGLLPKQVGYMSSAGEPLLAMTLTWVLFVGVIALTQASELGVGLLLQLAGQNFFVLYLLTAVGYIHQFQSHSHRRWIGALSVLTVLAMMWTFSLAGVIYCACLAGIGYALSCSAPQATKAPFR